MAESSDTSEAAIDPTDYNEEIEEPREICFKGIDLPPAKRRKVRTPREIDRLSALPDALLAEILTFLPSIEEAIRTGTLSSRWKSVWTKMHTLVFVHKCSRPISDFVSFVGKTLIQCRHSKLKKFQLSFNYKKDLASQVNMWIGYALSCNVEELLLHLVDRQGGANFKVPENIFIDSHLTDLDIRCSIFQPVSRVSWTALRNLTIVGVKLKEDVIQNMLSGSPVLESLTFGDCYGFSRLRIGSTSVKKLVLDGYNSDHITEANNVLEICAPHIVSLDIDGDLGPMKLILVNVKSLVEAKLDFYCYFWDREGDADQVMLKGLLEGLQHVKELVVGPWCIEVISSLELKGWRSPLSKRKYLKTTSFVRRSCFPGLINLMQSSPDLETLLINEQRVFSHTNSCGVYTRRNYLASRKHTFQCLHLKTVKIGCLLEWDREFELAQFLLQKASALEKMTIYIHRKNPTSSQTSTLLQLALKLLSCPRASKESVVLFPGLI